MTLTPLPGLKVSMNDALHFFVNKNFDNSELIQSALNLGIEKLKAKNEIRRAYIGTGCISKKE